MSCRITLVSTNHHFASRSNYHLSLDISLLRNHFEEQGFQVDVRSVAELLNEPLNKNTVYWFGGIPDRQRVQIFLEWALCSGVSAGKIIPSLELICCHENKGAQSIYAKKLNLPVVAQEYHIDQQRDFQYPLIWKSCEGSGSSKVKLLAGERDLRFTQLIEKVRKIPLGSTINWLKYYLYKTLVGSPDAKLRYEVKRIVSPFVIQKFIQNCDSDFKILNFGGHIYVLKRYVRKNDFRASGSGNFVFVEVSDSLLEFAEKFRNTIKAPFVSIDIINSNNQFIVVEYQVLSFGPYTQLNAPFYYTKSSGKWQQCAERSTLEYEYVTAVCKFVRQGMLERSVQATEP